MTKRRILELVQYFPTETAFQGDTHVSRERLLAWALSEPAFGYLLARTFADRHRPLPVQVSDLEIVRAHRRMLYPDRKPDRPLEAAFALYQPQQLPSARLMRALLIAKDISYSKIGKRLALSEDSVRLYHKLFFNVRDRRHDIGYISALVYGDEESESNKKPCLGLSLLRAAYEGGADAVFELARINLGAGKQMPSLKLVIHHLELELSKKALRNVRLGQENSPAIKFAVQLALAGKRTDGESSSEDTKMGLTGMSMRTPILDTLDRLVGQYSEEFRERIAAAGAVFGDPNKGKTETKEPDRNEQGEPPKGEK